jgi:GDP-L-fucose synthase
MGRDTTIGIGQDQTIRELAELVAEVVGFDGLLEFDSSKPDGTPRKLPDTSQLTALGWLPKRACGKVYYEPMESF